MKPFGELQVIHLRALSAEATGHSGLLAGLWSGQWTLSQGLLLGFWPGLAVPEWC